MDQDSFRYDVFISYSAADEEWAEDWLRPRLEQAGLQVCSDDDFEPGIPKLINIERAVGNSRQALLVLSPAWVASEWSEFAALLSQTSDPAARQRRLLPLLLQPCRLPPRITMLTHIDFTRPDKRHKQVQRIIKIIRGELYLPERPLTQDERNRRVTLDKVRAIWIRGLLEQSLAKVVRIELGLSSKHNVLDSVLNLQYQELDRFAKEIPAGMSIVEVFMYMGEQLLILGQPGAGKTTLLLELTRDLIDIAESDQSQSIPIVFNLSSFSEQLYFLYARRRRFNVNSPSISDLVQSLSQWFINEMNMLYGIPRNVGKAWLNNNRLLLLLDGLDEVKQEFREPCIAAINGFQREHWLLPMVVCSRVADYEELTIRLNLQGAVIINPLTIAQLKAYLAQAEDRLRTLRLVLRWDSTLQELARTPLMIEIMTIAYENISLSDIRLTGSITTQRQHLFDMYIDRMFTRRALDNRFTRNQVIHGLSWLAQGMIRQGTSIFLIENLQPIWLTIGAQQWIYKSGVLGLSFFISTIIYGIVFSMIDEFNKNISILSIDASFSSLQLGITVGLLVGMGVGWFILGERILPSGNSNRWIYKSFAQSLVSGMIFGLFGTLTADKHIGTIFGILGGSFIFSIALATKFARRIIFTTLWYTNTLPWEYNKFLNYCVNRIFLRKIGASYIFIHRLLMEHFSTMEISPRDID